MLVMRLKMSAFSYILKWVFIAIAVVIGIFVIGRVVSYYTERDMYIVAETYKSQKQANKINKKIKSVKRRRR